MLRLSPFSLRHGSCNIMPCLRLRGFFIVKKLRLYPQLNIKLKLYKNNKVVLDTTFKVINRFYSILMRHKFDLAYIKVTYLPTVYNDGEYTNRQTLVQAFRDFTEKDLIDTTYNKQW